jgi:hypothetical protein
MSSEEILIKGEVLISDAEFTRFIILYLVDEKERMSVRDDLHDLCCGKCICHNVDPP